MYKETVKPVGKTVFYVIGIVGAALLLTCIADLAITYYKLPYRSLFQLGVLAIVGVGVYILIRNILSDYSYSIVGEELLIMAKLGNHEWVVARPQLDQIKLVAFHTSPALQQYKAQARYNAKKSFFSSNTYICVFMQDGKLNMLKFEPSGKLLSILYKKGIPVKD